MSIYSGFSTRSQEAQYDKNIEALIALLSTRVLQSFKNNPQEDGDP